MSAIIRIGWKAAIFTFLLAVILASACSDRQVIRVGYVAGLSGRQSQLGVDARNGVQLMVDRINASGGIHGRKLELDIRDNRGEVDECGRILESMMADGIRFIVGPLLSKMAEVTAGAIEGRDVLVMSPTMATVWLSGKDDNLVRTIPTTARQASIIADAAAGKGMRSMAVVYDIGNRGFSEVLYEQFRKDAARLGIAVPLAVTLDNDNRKEMLSLARTLVETGADGIFLCMSAIDAANLSQQISKLGAVPQLFGANWTQTQDLIQLGGRTVEGMVLVSSQSYGEPTTASVDFRRLFGERYKEQPSFAAGRGYEAMGLLAEAMKRADEPTPAGVKAALLAISDYQGLEGPLGLDEFGDSKADYFLIKVKNGKFVPAD